MKSSAQAMMGAFLVGAAIAGVATVGYQVSAHGEGDGRREEPAAIAEALTSSDYEAWKAFHEEEGHDRVLEEIGQSEFEILAQAYQLRESGDKEGARALLEENDLRPPRGDRGERGGGREGMKEMRTLVEAGDYDAWRTAVEESGHTRILEVIDSAEKFEMLGEMHQLMQDGDREGAKAIADELGLPVRPGGPGHHGHGPGHDMEDEGDGGIDDGDEA